MKCVGRFVGPFKVTLLAAATACAASLDGSVCGGQDAAPRVRPPGGSEGCAAVADVDEVALLARVPLAREAVRLPARRRAPSIGEPLANPARPPPSSLAVVTRLREQQSAIWLVLALVALLSCSALAWHVCARRPKEGQLIYEDTKTDSWDTHETWVRRGGPGARGGNAPAASMLPPRGPAPAPPAPHVPRGRGHRDARCSRDQRPADHIPFIGGAPRQMRSPRVEEPAETAQASSSNATAAASSLEPGPASRSSFLGLAQQPGQLVEVISGGVQARSQQVLGMGSRATSAALSVGSNALSAGGSVAKKVKKQAKPLQETVKSGANEVKFHWDKAREGTMG